MISKRDRIFDQHKCKWRLVRHGDGSASIIEDCGKNEKPLQTFDSWDEAKIAYEELLKPLSQAELIEYVKMLVDRTQF